MLTSGAGSSSLALLVVAGSFSQAILFLTEARLQTEGSSGVVGSFSLTIFATLTWLSLCAASLAELWVGTNPTPTPRDARQTSRIRHDP